MKATFALNVNHIAGIEPVVLGCDYCVEILVTVVEPKTEDL